MCPYCHADETKVILTERIGDWIRRRRRCTKCGGEFHTGEAPTGIIKRPANLPTQPLVFFNFVAENQLSAHR